MEKEITIKVKFINHDADFKNEKHSKDFCDAVLNTFNAGISKKPYKCIKNVFVGKVNPDGTMPLHVSYIETEGNEDRVRREIGHFASYLQTALLDIDQGYYEKFCSNYNHMILSLI